MRDSSGTAEGSEEEDYEGDGYQGGESYNQDVVVFDGGCGALPEGGLWQSGQFDGKRGALGQVGGAPDAV